MAAAAQANWHEAGCCLPIADLRGFLEGGWSLVRLIDDRRAGQRGRFEGGVDFVGDGAALWYREAGEMRLGDFRGRATRAYRFEFPARHAARVHFDDGRFFHDLDLRGGRAAVLHLCGEDRYHGDFRVTGLDAWQVGWEIKGPRKDLRLSARLTRRPATASA